jgi:hypothetical protein
MKRCVVSTSFEAVGVALALTVATFIITLAQALFGLSPPTTLLGLPLLHSLYSMKIFLFKEPVIETIGTSH